MPEGPEEAEEEDTKGEMIEDREKVLFINLEKEAWRREELNIRSAKMEEKEEDIPKEYEEFNNQVFNKAVFEKLPDWLKWDHAIELIPNTTLKDCKVYPLNVKEQEELDKFLEEYLKSGQIWASKSPCAAPFFFVKKKDGSLRPVQDYWRLNEAMIKNKYPLLLIQELIDKVWGAKYFTKLNIQWGYNNVRIKERNEWKTAFQTNRGLFEPLVIYFGMCNSPATFQLMIDTLFWELIMTGKIVIYMDNILIFTQTIEEHWDIVRWVLQILANNKLSLHPKKCKFYQTKIKYLGVILSQDSIEADPTKIKGVAQWLEPRDKREVRQFLEFCNFYYRFIPGFARIAKPLTELMGKKEWKWQEEEKSTFNKLKKNPPTLAIPHPKWKMQLETDTSGYTIGGVLSQVQEDNSWRPLTYLSKTMNETKWNYKIYDWELLAIIEGLKQCVTNFIWSYLHQIFDNSYGLKTSLKPLRRPLDQCQSRLEAINNGQDIKQINW